MNQKYRKERQTFCTKNTVQRQLDMSRTEGTELSNYSTLQSQNKQIADCENRHSAPKSFSEKELGDNNMRKARGEFNVKLADSTVSSVK